MFKDDKQCQQFQADDDAQHFVKNTKKISEINAKDIDAIFVVGGVSVTCGSRQY
jgi:putative intracellular protease/amidase